MKVGIITFHNSYNCGSMLETYAMQTIVRKLGHSAEIVNFSSEGQRKLYAPFFQWSSIRNIIKNLLILPGLKRIQHNNEAYENFKNKNFRLSDFCSNSDYLTDSNYDVVIAGSDQIWNITIMDYDPAYYLNWVTKAKKVAYAPSFGARRIEDHASDITEFIRYLEQFDALSIRENNGQKWIKELLGRDVPVLLDPTLLLNREDYEIIENKTIVPNGKYIFFYSPSFDADICKFVQSVAKKYNLKVITWSTKTYCFKLIKRFGFSLPDYESPDVYLNLIKNAELVFTTSYHGTIFSTIYRKNFFTIKNGDMYGNDDRVSTLLGQLSMEDRLIEYKFDAEFNYMDSVDYRTYESTVNTLKQKSLEYLQNALGK